MDFFVDFFGPFSLEKQAGKNPPKNPRFSRELFDQNPLREISALMFWGDFLGVAEFRPGGYFLGFLLVEILGQAISGSVAGWGFLKGIRSLCVVAALG